MAGQRFIAHGATVTFSSADVGGLTSIAPPDRTKGEAEATDNDSGGDREFLPGIRDGGNVELTYRIIDGDAGQDALESNYAADRLIEECVITLPGSATDDSTLVTWTFDCFVTNLAPPELSQTDDGEAVTQSVTLKVDGAVTKATA